MYKKDHQRNKERRTKNLSLQNYQFIDLKFETALRS